MKRPNVGEGEEEDLATWRSPGAESWRQRGSCGWCPRCPTGSRRATKHLVSGLRTIPVCWQCNASSMRRTRRPASQKTRTLLRALEYLDQFQVRLFHKRGVPHPNLLLFSIPTLKTSSSFTYRLPNQTNTHQTPDVMNPQILAASIGGTVVIASSIAILMLSKKHQWQP